MDSLQLMTDWFHTALGVPPETQRKLLATAMTLLVVWSVHWLVTSVVPRRHSDAAGRYRVQKAAGYIAAAVLVVALARIWLADVQSLATYLGLLSAGLAIALQTLILNVAGWAFILIRRPFRVGDRIEVGAHRGDVVDLRYFEFTILEIGNWVDADQSTGRIIHVPNGAIFREPLANYTGGFRYIWIELPTLVTFESNWRLAKQLLLEIGHRHASDVSQDAAHRVAEANRRFLISYTHLEPTVYTEVRESGVLLTLRCLVSPRARRILTQRVWEDVLDAFAQHDDIEFAYPTWRVYNHATERRGRGTAEAVGTNHPHRL